MRVRGNVTTFLLMLKHHDAKKKDHTKIVSHLLSEKVWFFFSFFCKKVVITESTKHKNMELIIILAAFGTNNLLNLILHWMERGPDFHIGKFFQILLGSNSKVLEDFIGAMFLHFLLQSFNYTEIRTFCCIRYVARGTAMLKISLSA